MPTLTARAHGSNRCGCPRTPLIEPSLIVKTWSNPHECLPTIVAGRLAAYTILRPAVWPVRQARRHRRQQLEVSARPDRNPGRAARAGRVGEDRREDRKGVGEGKGVAVRVERAGS